jgi:GH24 family phage-related lysozyme (muramidase)
MLIFKLIQIITLTFFLILSIARSDAINVFDEFKQERKTIEKYEGFSSRPYEDVNGKKVIGYGHTLKHQEKNSPINKPQAEMLLLKDIENIRIFIKNNVDVFVSSGQKEALVSLIYNWGRGNFLKSKGFMCLNKSNYDQAAIEFFSKEHGVVYVSKQFSQGLYDRRQAELKLWND